MNDPYSQQAIDTRKEYVEAWNKTMVNIWKERIYMLGVIHSGDLYHSVTEIEVKPDGRYYSITFKQGFADYGIWQDMGVGREIPHGNPGDAKALDPDYRERRGLNKPRKRGTKWGGGYTSGNPREKRRWFSTKYYSSYMNLRDFMAESLAGEFCGMFANLDAQDYRGQTKYYQKKGWS